MWKYLVLSGSMSRQRLTLLRASASYLEARGELEGDCVDAVCFLADPGNLGRIRSRLAPDSTREPVVAVEGLTASPPLPPGCQEFRPPKFGLVGCCWIDCAFCAKAGVVRTNGRTVRMARARVWYSLWVCTAVQPHHAFDVPVA